MSVAGKYEEPRAHAVRERYLDTFGGEGLPVPVEAIAEDLLGLRIEESWAIDCSGMLLPAERLIVLNAHEKARAQKARARDAPPLRRFRFTIAHEIGHWVCHCLEGRAQTMEPSYCRPVDLTEATDRALEREANVFAAELLMPEPAVREVWAELLARSDERSGPELAAAVTACARRFDVSPTAMQWRLYAFGLVDEQPA